MYFTLATVFAQVVLAQRFDVLHQSGCAYPSLLFQSLRDAVEDLYTLVVVESGFEVYFFVYQVSNSTSSCA